MQQYSFSSLEHCPPSAGYGTDIPRVFRSESLPYGIYRGLLNFNHGSVLSNLLQLTMPIYRRYTGSHLPFHETRSLHDDERYVMDTYQLHASTCLHCADSRRPTSLCEQGNILAQNVGKYLYKNNGRFFAVTGHEYDTTNQVKISQHLYAVRDLLAAIECGLQPGASSTGRPRHVIEIIERQPRHFEASPRAIQYPSFGEQNTWISKRNCAKKDFVPLSRSWRLELGVRLEGQPFTLLLKSCTERVSKVFQLDCR